MLRQATSGLSIHKKKENFIINYYSHEKILIICDTKVANTLFLVFIYPICLLPRLQDLTLLVPVITIVSSQYDYVSECPEENGFFADALQCDRYYECNDGEVCENLVALFSSL